MFSDIAIAGFRRRRQLGGVPLFPNESSAGFGFMTMDAGEGKGKGEHLAIDVSSHWMGAAFLNALCLNMQLLLGIIISSNRIAYGIAPHLLMIFRSGAMRVRLLSPTRYSGLPESV